MNPLFSSIIRGSITWQSVAAGQIFIGMDLKAQAALVEFLELAAEEKFRILSFHRPSSIQIKGVVIRDQKPLTPSKLCLQDGLLDQQWFELLNGRVFFWASCERLERFIAAYGMKRKVVIEVRTRDLVERYRTKIQLSHINSGATRMNNVARGRNTFLSIEEYPYSKKFAPAEVTVFHSVPDIAQLANRIIETGGGLPDVTLL